jgi:hypothetical protein
MTPDARDDIADIADGREVDAALEAAVRTRLAAMAATAVVPPDAWEQLQTRTAASPHWRRPARARRRLLVAAAVLLLLVGSAVVESPDADTDHVETQDATTTTTQGDDGPDGDTRTDEADDPETVDETRDAQLPAPEADDDVAPVGPGAAPSGEGVRPTNPGPASGGGTGTGTPNPPAPGAVPLPVPTTTTTAPPSRLPGDITVVTSSGVAVELVLDERPGQIGAFVRRTDSGYDPTSPALGTPSDGYVAAGGVVIAGEAPALGARCVRSGSTVSGSLAPHSFTLGLVGSEVSAVQVRTAGGQTISAQVTSRSVANGVRAYIAEVPSHDVIGVDAMDAAGGLVATATPSETYLCG